ncbi:GNAT family N-acetyltransferase [Azospirillum sp. ST 5-10]|uniref:GNAT family N-acetyltransferase n=1 Tax=unclassified Azospirillum TaxID=2630922 RepID=UPI003F4A444F
MRLVRLAEVEDRGAALAALEAIFFLSAQRRTFATPQERSAFLATWTGWYVTHAAADLWFAHAADGAADGAPIGYLTGCRDSAGAHDLFRIIPRYDAFADRFAAFPAHLHVNVHPDHRNAGVGAALIAAFAADCRTAGLPGVHVVTGADARNVPFYRRNGFTDADRRGPLLFLGRRLSSGIAPGHSP